ncbi:MAG: hypothetical protein FWF54_02855 [Candidatus Azobacteroides sp.]|nr:hypothetical protein [Candidatus Azobacteroides sp.]
MKRVQTTLCELMSDISEGRPIDCSLHSSDREIVFAFIVNGVCATFHIKN